MSLDSVKNMWELPIEFNAFCVIVKQLRQSGGYTLVEVFWSQLSYAKVSEG